MSYKIIERFCKQHNALREARQGVMLHYDVSSSDAGGLEYFYSDEAAERQISYDFWISRKGKIYRLVPPGRRAWHAGACEPALGYRYRDANSAFVGVCIAAHPGERATPAQLDALIWLLSSMAENNGWSATDLRWVTGHNRQAAPRGRKQDPEGPDPKHVVLSVEAVRTALRDAMKPKTWMRAA